jgi:thiamine transporter
MKKRNTWMLVEGSMMVGLAIVLGEFVKLFEMPMGGSVTAGAMVPLFLFAYRWGGKQGIFAGVVYGILDLIIGGVFSLHPVSLIFDYPVAFGILGIAGFFKKTPAGLISGVFAGIFGRFACHTFSGVVAYASYAPEGQSPLLYSILYNGSYLLPEFAITVFLTVLILKFVKLPEPKTAT